MDNQNFIAAVVLSIGILVGFHFFYEKPQLEKSQRLITLAKEAKMKAPKVNEALEKPVILRDRKEILSDTKRIIIETSELNGSINLKGARLDDLQLTKYRETVDANSPEITLLSPVGSKSPHRAYFASFGWLSSNGIKVPNDNTIWKTNSKKLSVDNPVILTWKNNQGVTFKREISIDEHFLFTIKDSVKNDSGKSLTLYPFGRVSRYGKQDTAGTYVMHEGPIGVLGGTLKEIKYNDLVEEGKDVVESEEGGWLGITDKYWLVSLIPDQSKKIVGSFSYDLGKSKDPYDGIYQADFRADSVNISSGEKGSWTTHLFAGAKKVRLLDKYEKDLSIPLFDRAIDFGWYYYLTKPFLYLLDEISTISGHMWIAILVFTLMLKIVTLPLSIKSMKSMAKMKALQPEMERLKKRYKEDRQKMSVATMELYQREGVNPMSGCMPMIIQIPIFFALYKVLYVGIEMRHTPLFGWIKDMSAQDPTSVLTFFGAFDMSFIPHIGVWPILMGISMFVQQKMSPTSGDKTQAQIFLMMPIIFTFMLKNMAVGLIFYWTISNILGVAQQWYISRHVRISTGAK